MARQQPPPEEEEGKVGGSYGLAVVLGTVVEGARVGTGVGSWVPPSSGEEGPMAVDCERSKVPSLPPSKGTRPILSSLFMFQET